MLKDQAAIIAEQVRIFEDMLLAADRLDFEFPVSESAEASSGEKIDPSPAFIVSWQLVPGAPERQLLLKPRGGSPVPLLKASARAWQTVEPTLDAAIKTALDHPSRKFLW